MKVKSIKLKVQEPSVLPDGFYVGTWSAYVIELKVKGQEYQLETEEGIKGLGCRVIVEVKEGIATFKEANN